MSFSGIACRECISIHSYLDECPARHQQLRTQLGSEHPTGRINDFFLNEKYEL